MVVYNNSKEVITFQMVSKRKKTFSKKKFSQIIQLEVDATVVVPSYEQILGMLNEMGYTPSITLINDFWKPKVPYLWSFLFRIIIRCLTEGNLDWIMPSFSYIMFW